MGLLRNQHHFSRGNPYEKHLCPCLGLIVGIGAILGTAAYWGSAMFMKREAVLPRLNTGGTSAVDFMMDRWCVNFRKKHKDVDVKYQSTGSKKGIQAMLDGQFDIAFTHVRRCPRNSAS